MTRKTQETKADALDKIFAEIDPMAAACGVLGGVAAANGIVPPFTRLLQMFGMAFGGSASGDVAKDVTVAVDRSLLYGALGGPFVGSGTFYGTLIGGFLNLGNGAEQSTSGLGSQTSAPATDQEIAGYQARIGLAASGALEAILMYELMKHPELLETMIKQPAEMLKGLGEIVPG